MKNCESFGCLARHKEEEGFPPRPTRNEGGKQKGRNRNGRSLPAYGAAAAPPAENPVDFSFRSFSTDSWDVGMSVGSG